MRQLQNNLKLKQGFILNMRNSTIISKKRNCKSCGRNDYIFSKGRCSQCAKIEDTQKRMERETEKLIQEEDLSGLISDADAVFSQFIRLKYADDKGYVACYTCGNKKHYTLMQNGHYIKRGHLYLRWDERNCRPQDADCNEFKSGNMAEYTLRLDKECKGLPDILKDEMRMVHHVTRDEIRAIISEYTPKVKELKKRLK